MRCQYKDVNMKVVCISNTGLDFTKGKIYDVYSERGDFYQLENDNGYLRFLRKEYFVDIRKIRDDKLKELGI